jgi:ketosteroid isomerase-like protein
MHDDTRRGESIGPTTRVLIAALTLAAAAASPQSAVDDLLAADHAFAAASAKTDLVSGLVAMFADDVVIPMPPGQFVDGKAAVAAALSANADNLTSRTDWAPVRGGVSADGQHGFTFGYMTIHRQDGSDLPLKYLSYCVKQADGWRVAAFKRTRMGAAPSSREPIAPALPGQLVAPTSDPQRLAEAKESLDRAERSFSADAQKIGIGKAFAQYGSADAINLGRPDDPGFVTGSGNIGRMVSQGVPEGTSPVSWTPERVIVASSGDLGVTIGWIVPNTPSADRPARNPFFTIWRRASATAPWRYVAE